MKKATITHPPVQWHITGDGQQGKSALAMAVLAYLASIDPDQKKGMYWLWPTDGRQVEYLQYLGKDQCFIPKSNLFDIKAVYQEVMVDVQAGDFSGITGSCIDTWTHLFRLARDKDKGAAKDHAGKAQSTQYIVGALMLTQRPYVIISHEYEAGIDHIGKNTAIRDSISETEENRFQMAVTMKIVCAKNNKGEFTATVETNRYDPQWKPVTLVDNLGMWEGMPKKLIDIMEKSFDENGGITVDDAIYTKEYPIPGEFDGKPSVPWTKAAVRYGMRFVVDGVPAFEEGNNDYEHVKNALLLAVKNMKPERTSASFTEMWVNELTRRALKQPAPWEQEDPPGLKAIDKVIENTRKILDEDDAAEDQSASKPAGPKVIVNINKTPAAGEIIIVAGDKAKTFKPTGDPEGDNLVRAMEEAQSALDKIKEDAAKLEASKLEVLDPDNEGDNEGDELNDEELDDFFGPRKTDEPEAAVDPETEFTPSSVPAFGTEFNKVFREAALKWAKAYEYRDKPALYFINKKSDVEIKKVAEAELVLCIKALKETLAEGTKPTAEDIQLAWVTWIHQKALDALAIDDIFTNGVSDEKEQLVAVGAGPIDDDEIPF